MSELGFIYNIKIKARTSFGSPYIFSAISHEKMHQLFEITKDKFPIVYQNNTYYYCKRPGGDKLEVFFKSSVHLKKDFESALLNSWNSKFQEWNNSFYFFDTVYLSSKENKQCGKNFVENSLKILAPDPLEKQEILGQLSFYKSQISFNNSRILELRARQDTIEKTILNLKTENKDYNNKIEQLKLVLTKENKE